MALNIPDSPLPRLVVIGAGFGGLQFVKILKRNQYQVVILDRNNFHQFQPLFYQVAMAGLEPSSIAFPIRKMFQKQTDIHIRPVIVEQIDVEKKRLKTEEGEIYYDHLVIATGAKTNFYGQDSIEARAYSLKSITEALHLRNEIFSDLEVALTKDQYDERQRLIDIVIVGGGPTGVEIAGALAEMKNYIVPKDYVELDHKEIDIYLVQSGDRLLNTMSQKASKKAKQFLEKLGVHVLLNQRVTGFDGRWVETNTGQKIEARKLIWCAGVKADSPLGLPDRHCKVVGLEEVYAIGDVAFMESEGFPHGHPQVAQAAIQQGQYLARVLNPKTDRNKLKGFRYKDKGSLATIGRNKAVADIPGYHFAGFFAWIVWLIVHLFALIGVKNKVFVFLNWLWNYLTYDQSLRLIIRPFRRNVQLEDIEKKAD